MARTKRGKHKRDASAVEEDDKDHREHSEAEAASSSDDSDSAGSSSSSSGSSGSDSDSSSEESSSASSGSDSDEADVERVADASRSKASDADSRSRSHHVDVESSSEDEDDSDLEVQDMDALGRAAKAAEDAALGLDEQRKDAEWDVYHDDEIFDNVMHLIPSPATGKWLLVASFVMQMAIVIIGFLGHHHRDSAFDCCNMWAVCVAILVLAMQIAYVTEWFDPKKGERVSWHRGNLFVPVVVFLVVFLEWAAATLSMIARASGFDILGWVSLGELNGWQWLAFLVCSGCVGVSVIVLFMVDYTHRNNIGEHYYYVEERPDAQIIISDEPTKNRGTMGLSLIPQLAAFLLVDITKRAVDHLPRLVRIGTLLQLPFYLFACIAYTQGTTSTIAPITLMSLGLLSFGFSWQYLVSASGAKSPKLRRWNRVNLFFPTKVLALMVVVYVVTMSNMFFRTVSTDIFDAVPELNLTESVYFVFNTSLIFLLLCVQLLLTVIHRKVWASERDTPNGVRDPLDVRAEKAIFGVSIADDLAAQDSDSDSDSSSDGSSSSSDSDSSEESDAPSSFALPPEPGMPGADDAFGEAADFGPGSGDEVETELNVETLAGEGEGEGADMDSDDELAVAVSAAHALVSRRLQQQQAELAANQA